MPTGYTYKVIEGDLSFKNFALDCARAFGALISMRDDPANAVIPDKIEPDISYYQERMKELQERLDFLTDPSKQEDVKLDWQKTLNKVADERFERFTKYRQSISRLNAMLKRVNLWTPPSPDHEEMKKFMIQQLEDSIKWEIDPTEYDSAYKMPKFEIWLDEEVENIRENLVRYQTQIDDEIQLAENRTNWIVQLKNSLDNIDIELGSFNTDGKLLVSDPCYEKGTWCTYTLEVAPGKYNARLKMSDEGDWGVRVSDQIIVLDGYKYDDFKEILENEAHIGVDSGQAGFFDEALYPNGNNVGSTEFYNTVCDLTSETAPCGGIVPVSCVKPGDGNFGVVSSSGYGDGGYPLYVIKDGDRIVGARICFIGEYDDPEDTVAREVVEGDPENQ